MNKSEVERLLSAYDRRLSALTAEVDALRREVAMLRGDSRGADGTMTVSRKDVGTIVSAQIKPLITSAVDLAVARATDATRREVEPRMGAIEVALKRTMTHLAYKTDDCEQSTHDYRMAALTEADGPSRRAIMPSSSSSGGRQDIITGAVRLAFTDDD